MNKRSLPFLALLILLPSASALAATPGLQAPDFKIQRRATPQGKLDIRALAPSGHHFNLQAPMSFTWLGAGGSAPAKLQPIRKDPLTLEFIVPSQNSARDFRISAYLCDDKDTYCERHAIRATAPPSVASSGKAAPSQPKVAGDTASGAEGRAKRPLGFILNDPESAFRQAKAHGKLVMIDFFAIWCPPCNELDEHVFSAPGFRKKTSGFVRLKLDVDARASWPWKAKYGIRGYPTIVFVTAEGDEVGRIVGFRPLGAFLADARLASKNRDASYARLRARADSGDRAASAKLGLMEYDRANWAEAKKYLALSGETKQYGEQLAEAEIGLIEQASETSAKPGEASDTQLIQALEKSIRDYPDTPDSIDRRMRLAEIYGDRKDAQSATNQKKILLDAVQAAQALIRDPKKLQNQDCTPGDLWEEIGDAYEDAGEPEKAREAYRSGAREYRRLMKSDSERGYSLELAYCLWKSGDVEGAQAIYAKFEKLYPDEFTFFFNHARMEHSLQKNTDARKLAQTAYLHSYGDNKLRSGKLLADIFEAQGEKAQALAVAKRALAEVPLPKDSSLRAHRYAKQLQDMVARLSR